jgi:hypothetical protein
MRRLAALLRSLAEVLDPAREVHAHIDGREVARAVRNEQRRNGTTGW